MQVLHNSYTDYHESDTANPVNNLVITGGYHHSTPMGGVFLHDPEYFDMALDYMCSRMTCLSALTNF